MRRIWSGRGRDSDVEARLRDERPTAPADLVARLTAEVGERRRPSLQLASRLAFAAALSTFMIGGFASLGGVGYASANVEAAAHVVKQVVAEAPLVRQTTSASDQYEPGDDDDDAGEVAGEQTTGGGGPAGEEVAPQDDVLGTVETQETLPFTGAALVPTAVIGMMFIVLGVFLRRREPRRD